MSQAERHLTTSLALIPNGFSEQRTVPMGNLFPIESILRKIFYLRGEKILLDRDLANLYGVETRALNQAVTRNLERFPEDFMFSLTREEIMRISQSVISSRIKYAKQVRAFTEQGVAMLSSVLNSSRAIAVNIAIMRAFVHLRKASLSNAEISEKFKELEVHLHRHDEEIRLVFETIRKLIEPSEESPKKIGYTAKEQQAEYDTRNETA